MKAGKRTLKRQAMNKRLKKLFIEKSYPQTCELKLQGCLGTWALTWAHSKKSRFLITDDDWMEAALACVHCHNIIEAKSHEEMFNHVTTAINRRPKNNG